MTRRIKTVGRRRPAFPKRRRPRLFRTASQIPNVVPNVTQAFPVLPPSWNASTSPLFSDVFPARPLFVETNKANPTSALLLEVFRSTVFALASASLKAGQVVGGRVLDDYVRRREEEFEAVTVAAGDVALQLVATSTADAEPSERVPVAVLSFRVFPDAPNRTNPTPAWTRFTVGAICRRLD